MLLIGIVLVAIGFLVVIAIAFAAEHYSVSQEIRQFARSEGGYRIAVVFGAELVGVGISYIFISLIPRLLTN